MTRFIRSATLACSLFALSCAASAQEASTATSGPQLTPAAKHFLPRLQPNTTRSNWTTIQRNEFQLFDADSNAELSVSDIEIHKIMRGADTRAVFIMQITRADVDNDGAVTEQELRRRLQYDQRMVAQRVLTPPSIDSQIRQMMALDANGDGKVTLDEARQYAPPAAVGAMDPMRWDERISQTLALLPAGKNTLPLSEFEEMAAAFFSAVDADKNDVVTKEEIEAYRLGNVAPKSAEEKDGTKKQAEKTPQQIQAEKIQAQKEQAEKIQAQKAQKEAELKAQKEAEQRAECPMPKPSDNAKVMLLSATDADALPTATVGSQDIAMSTGVVSVEEGSEPLYVVIASYRPVIWRFSGAVARIERVVLGASSAGRGDNREDISIAGATGVLADRVSFLKAKCLGYFTEKPSIQAARTTSLVGKVLEKEPAVVAGTQRVSGFAIPSGEIRTPSRSSKPTLVIEKTGGTLTLKGNADVIVQTQSGAADLARDVGRYYPGGIVEMDPQAVVSSKPVERYEVLPGYAGLLQLIQSGALTKAKGREFLIHKKIRMPAELSNAKFLLLKGVPAPDGHIGHSCVLVEETGEPLGSASSCH